MDADALNLAGFMRRIDLHEPGLSAKIEEITRARRHHDHSLAAEQASDMLLRTLETLPLLPARQHRRLKREFSNLRHFGPGFIAGVTTTQPEGQIVIRTRHNVDHILALNYPYNYPFSPMSITSDVAGGVQHPIFQSPICAVLSLGYILPLVVMVLQGDCAMLPLPPMFGGVGKGPNVSVTVTWINGRRRPYAVSTTAELEAHVCQAELAEPQRILFVSRDELCVLKQGALALQVRSGDTLFAYMESLF